MTTKATKKCWKIGELAKETNLTVRALHHYDQIGLLKPSQETEGGHRVYSTADVEKLQKIMTLKQLGFSLDKIKEAIASPGFSLRSATTQLRLEIEKKMTDLSYALDGRSKQTDRITGKHRSSANVYAPRHRAKPERS